MPVRIIKDSEKGSMVYEGGTFYYRRPPIKMRKKWTNECTNRHGVIDFYGVMEKATPHCLLGWDPGAVVDEDMKDVPFSYEAAAMLPEDFYIAFAEHLGLSQLNQEAKEGETKNLKSTSS